MSVDVSEARPIVEELRAFYGFLKREFGLKQAGACLRVLGTNAVEKLEAALSDSSNFGMAKSLFMAGAEAGFDVQSKDGIEAWIRSIQDKPLPSSILLPAFDAQPSSKKTATAKKDKRKAARKARKRNR